MIPIFHGYACFLFILDFPEVVPVKYNIAYACNKSFEYVSDLS
jgi:hypothetical protein